MAAFTEDEAVDEQERLKRKWATVEALVGAEKRLALVAEDKGLRTAMADAIGNAMAHHGDKDAAERALAGVTNAIVKLVRRGGATSVSVSGLEPWSSEPVRRGLERAGLRPEILMDASTGQGWQVAARPRISMLDRLQDVVFGPPRR